MPSRKIYLFILLLIPTLTLHPATAESTSTHPPNHLANETSPYLLLHAHNPVDWYPWGPEALERARREDKPIFLSVGYSTCYWCHVMERNVFSNQAIADLMNQWFVNIKVDREERPDLDKIYMTATQIITRQGGWPNSVFLTPDLKPFFAGTYFPPQDSYGRPGFPSVLTFLHQAWVEQRQEVEDQANQLTQYIEELSARPDAPALAPDSVMVNRARDALQGRYDGLNGGFGGAPKFPPCINLEFLLDLWERQNDERLLGIVRHSLAVMAAGGIYDHVGGGFHRYATDAQWRVPHFEKMLYNQAHMAHLYLRAYKLTNEPAWRRVAEDIFRFVAREMTSPAGAFYSALDAETETVEGKYYLWTEEQLEEILGERFELFEEIYDLAPMPEDEGWVVYRTQELEAAAADLEMSLSDLEEQIEALRAPLLALRSQRTYPLLDDKIITSWNGMMITAYAYAYEVLKEPAYRQTAEQAATFVLRHMRGEDGKLKRVYRQNVAKYDGYLEDYAFFARGLLDLYRATNESRWLTAARDITEHMETNFWDEEGKGFFYTAGGADLIVRLKNAQDSALPAANAVAVHNLLDLAAWTGDSVYLERARQSLHVFGGTMQASPTAFVHLIAAADRYLNTDWSHQQPTGSILNLATPLYTTPAAPPDSVLQTRIVVSETQLIPNQLFTVTVHLDIHQGWHINANPPSSDLLIPTSLTLNADLPVEILSFEYPSGTPYHFPATQENLNVYTGQVTLKAHLRLKSEAQANQQGKLNLLLQYQACDDTLCLPPAEHLASVQLNVAAKN